MKIKLKTIVKTAAIKIIAVSMLFVMLDSTAFSQTRIRFARGTTSKTVSGNIASNGSVAYILRASKGQKMLVRVSSGTGKVWIDIGGNRVGKGTTINLPSTDDYIITVHTEGRATRYSLYVSIK
ncbi:hypothetical protein BH10ACI1_BH10ACI1_08050 [soil metagenome]